ncbi:MAG: hypothetical protein ACFCD0_05070 [Gemmataceae bacterium]
MPKPFFLERVLVSRTFLIVVSIIVLGSVFALTLNQLAIVFSKFQFDRAAVEDEETIGIFFIAFGVFLEGRELLALRVLHTDGEHESPEQEETNHICEYYGFVLLVIGLAIELVDQICRMIEGLTSTVLVLEVGINVPLNLWGVWLLFVTIYKLGMVGRKKDGLDAPESKSHSPTQDNDPTRPKDDVSANTHVKTLLSHPNRESDRQ